MRKGPLSGFTVVDLTRVLAGPYCTMLLAELGARVIKVEPPGRGDDARQYGPFIQGRPCYFGSINRDKESIALDLHEPGDREIFEAMLAKADMVVENFRPGVMERLGYGWETLHARYPKLIYVACSGYGHTGPSMMEPSYDMAIQAISGIMSITGTEDSEPSRVGISIADIGAGVYAATAANAAFVHRERTGEATKVDIAMLDCLVSMLENPITRYVMTGEIGRRRGSRHPSIMPFEAFRTSDSYIVLACGNDKIFKLLSGAIGQPELADDPRFRTNSDRVAHSDLLHDLIEAVVLNETTTHWLEIMQRAGVPAGPINNIEQALQHPQVAARNMLVDTVDPVIGPLKLVGNPLKIWGFEDPTSRRCAPDLDQDRESILAELGMG